MADRQTDKTSRWAFTAYESQWQLFEVMPDLVAEWGWQVEVCPETSRKHYQGWLRTKRQCRFAQIAKILQGVHIEQARDWNALLNYCKKKDSAIAGSQTHQVATSQSLSMADALINLAKHMDYVPLLSFLDEGSEEYKKRYEREFWAGVSNILAEKPQQVALYTQPQYFRAWANTRKIWIQHCLDSIDIEETDRQTDTIPNNSFLPEEYNKPCLKSSPPSLLKRPVKEVRSLLCRSELRIL